MQKVVWDDFLDNDVELLLTEEEMHPLEEIVTRENTDQLTKQQEIVKYLEAKIPDLEEIMMEKALKLKEDLLQERISGMEKFYADKPANLAKINEAKIAIASGLYQLFRWHPGRIHGGRVDLRAARAEAVDPEIDQRARLPGRAL